jgi:antirestriction protein
MNDCGAKNKLSAPLIYLSKTGNYSYFKEYARELAEDTGTINKSNEWPNYCIDWERAAAELKMDYTSVEVDGETYWFRAY